ncbi:MAG: glucose 1-dehydrogenase [Candidatus Omnitrophica bacterium]|nr:glucose 1-dehydrogenase [Candidatus Omnitrophota bacterium]
MRLKNRTAVITGAGRGIGKAAALLFAKEGACVVAVDLDADRGEATVREIRESTGSAVFVQADVSKAEQVKKIVSVAVEKFGSVNILYNNAAVFLPTDGAVTEIQEENWDRILDINLKGTFLCCKYAIPEILRANGGSIINTSSSAGVVGVPGCDAYTATKGAVIALTRSMAVEYGPKIRVNCIVPCAVETAMNVSSAGVNPNFDEKRFFRMAPSGRYGTPEEVAMLALFLASDESSFCYGGLFVADGGVTIRNLSY